MIRVMVVDDQASARMGLSMMVERDPGLSVVATADDGEAALAELARRKSAGEPLPDVVVSDVRMPGMGGVTLAREVASHFPTVRTLLLTTYDRDDYALGGLAAGAAGFLLKDATARGLIYFERDILAHNVNILNIHALEYTGYVAHICDMKSYFDENLKLIDDRNLEALFPKGSPIYTKIRDDNPTRYVTGSKVVDSILADGCVIEGTVENCVLFRGVKVKKGAVVKNCVLMQDTVVEPNVELDCVVTDKNVKITAGKKLSGTESFPVYVQKKHTV